MTRAISLTWYIKRLARMQPAEVVHRIIEQARKIRDSSKSRSWEDFGASDKPLIPLPGLQRPVKGSLIGLRALKEVALIRAKRFRWLNQTWPSHLEWDSLWHIDPVTLRSWPGRGTFAFDARYRHIRDKGDVKFVWEPNRLQFLPLLALNSDWEIVSDVLHSWMKCNPPFEGINWASGIEAASRLISILCTFAFADPNTAANLDATIRALVDAHIHWIRRYPSLYSSANNHRVAELTGVFVGAVCAPGLASSYDIIQECKNELEQHMQQLFYADGVGAEQSTCYATYALEWFALAGIVGDASGHSFSRDYKARAAEAASHLVWLLDANLCAPQIGDYDGTRVLAVGQSPEPDYIASVLSLVGRWLSRPDLAPKPREDHIRDLLCAAPQSPTPSPSLLLGTRVFDEGGYTVMRKQTNQGTLVGVFDHGPLGYLSIAAHGHADALSLWLSWGDDPIFVDAGTYLYHSGGNLRDHFRSTSAHNTLALENSDQSLMAGPFNWTRHAQCHLMSAIDQAVVAEHDGYVRRFGVRHRREVKFDGAAMVVRDWLVGKPKRNRALEWKLGFLLAPEILAELDGKSVRLQTPRGRALRLTLQPETAVGWQKEPAQFSPSFNCCTQGERLIVKGVAQISGSELVSEISIHPLN